MKTRYKVWREINMEGGDRVVDLTTTSDDNTLLLDDIHVGDEFLVVETYNEMRPKENSRFTLFRTNEGLSGNANWNIKRYHGWRGTSDNLARFAHGVHKVISIDEIHTETQEQLVQSKYSPILAYDYDVENVTGHWAYVTIGEDDVHPDWE